MDALAAVRAIVPATIGAVPGTTADVGGDVAATKDANDNLSTHAPLVFGFVLAMAFLLLLVTFRSIVIPIKAIALNLLSVAAAFGVLTMVFQHGLGEAIGMPHTKGIASWLPVFLFVILFGLSMDYHVFILSRIKEGWDKGLGNDVAVEQGIRGSAGVVTAAAAVMVAVFAIFATLSLVDLQEFGVGLAVAVAIDATLIRGVVLPGGDEAARQVELVHAAQPRLAARARPRRGARAARRHRLTGAHPERPDGPPRGGPSAFRGPAVRRASQVVHCEGEGRTRRRLRGARRAGPARGFPDPVRARSTAIRWPTSTRPPPRRRRARCWTR